MSSVQQTLFDFLNSLKMNMIGGYTPLDKSVIKDVMKFAKNLIGAPYIWYTGGPLLPNNQFWSSNEKCPSIEEIRCEGKSIVCTGLINLMRRYLGLGIPGLTHSKSASLRKFYEEHQFFREFPGGTGTWWNYLEVNKRLEDIDLTKKYPIGTLLLSEWVDNNLDQGHVGVIYDSEGNTIKDQNFIHSVPDILIKDSTLGQIVGDTRIENFGEFNKIIVGEKKDGYWQKVCLPENWLLIN
jgi:hypothetical protein